MFRVENRGFRGICLHFGLSLPAVGSSGSCSPAGAALPGWDLCLSPGAAQVPGEPKATHVPLDPSCFGEAEEPNWATEMWTGRFSSLVGWEKQCLVLSAPRVVLCDAPGRALALPVPHGTSPTLPSLPGLGAGKLLPFSRLSLSLSCWAPNLGTPETGPGMVGNGQEGPPRAFPCSVPSDSSIVPKGICHVKVAVP